MRIRRWVIAVGVGICLSSSPTLVQNALAMSPPPMLGQAHVSSDPAPDLSIENTRRFQTRWPLITLFVSGLGAIAFGLQQYRDRCRWQRIDYARQAVVEFKKKSGVKNILSILDFEEYRTQYYTDPLTGTVKSFEATDARLRRSLRDHDAMVKIKAALLTVEREHNLFHDNSAGDRKFIDFDTVNQYRNIEFPVEVTLRNWFDEFLTGLEDIESMIEGGLFTARDIKPFILYWIQVIADRTVRRKGGASFYDPLFYYIHHSGYSGVEALFERYGYKVLPPPYTKHDFEQTSDSESTSFPKSSVYPALCCAKAAMLVYEDEGYMKDIARLWLQDDDVHNYRQQSDQEFLAGVIADWQSEHLTTSLDLPEYFKAFEDRETDTQAFLFRKGKHIILVFRGTEKFQDWQTNLSLSLRKFQSTPPRKSSFGSILPPKGKVHRGFLKALQSIENNIVNTLDAWNARIPSDIDLKKDSQTEIPNLWITGHSLGGALASLAAVSLKHQNFNVTGIYTFGQPRVGDWTFSKTAVAILNQPNVIPIERYANNNDIVPLIPPGFVPWQPTRRYGHYGQFHYFDSSGNLQKSTFPGQRLPDRLWGFLSAMLTTGPDAVSDHFMEFYIANLQKAIEQEQDALKMKEK